MAPADVVRERRRLHMQTKCDTAVRDVVVRSTPLIAADAHSGDHEARSIASRDN